eukprot:11154536-Lingulodinium_polyedra.AAC.1
MHAACPGCSGALRRLRLAQAAVGRSRMQSARGPAHGDQMLLMVAGNGAAGVGACDVILVGNGAAAAGRQ